jgi:hypothetical protein
VADQPQRGRGSNGGAGLSSNPGFVSGWPLTLCVVALEAPARRLEPPAQMLLKRLDLGAELEEREIEPALFVARVS